MNRLSTLYELALRGAIAKLDSARDHVTINGWHGGGVNECPECEAYRIITQAIVQVRRESVICRREVQ